jgi:hypothetical protein
MQMSVKYALATISSSIEDGSIAIQLSFYGNTCSHLKALN